MKRTILLLLVAVLSVATMSAQETRKATYVIDGKHIENFDGSQLKGKTIVNYSISPSGIHDIRTSDFSKGKTINEAKAIVVDSIPQPYVEVYADSTNQEQLTSAAETGAIIATEIIQSKEDQIVYVVNGKVIPFSDIKDIPSSKIASMEVIRNKEKLEYIKYANEAKVFNPKAIIKITTK